MVQKRDLNFQLSELSEESTRDHFIEVQEVHDEQKIASLYENGYGIFTERFEAPRISDSYRQAPGEIVFLSGRSTNSDGLTYQMSYSRGTGSTSGVKFGFEELNNKKSYNVYNGETTVESVSIFIIYKRDT